MKKYRLLEDSMNYSRAKKGMIVHEFIGYDYGLSNSDTAVLGIDFISVNLPDEKFFFTIPEEHLEEIND